MIFLTHILRTLIAKTKRKLCLCIQTAKSVAV